MADSTLYIHNITLVTPDRIGPGSLLAENGRIASIQWQEQSLGKDVSGLLPDCEIIDGNGGYLLAGFIDVHVHGGNGSEFMEPSTEAFENIIRFHTANGTTTILPTTVTASKEAIDAALQTAATYQQQAFPYAHLEGVHLEGPFISPKWPGAQDPNFITPPQLSWLQQWQAEFPDLVKLVTLAPETEGASEAIAWLAENGIVAAAGHTDAVYEQIAAAQQAGLSHAVHMFNAMRPLHHREPGTVGAVLELNAISTELIADGYHVHPAAIRLVLQAKPDDKVLLITDAMSAAGLGDGQYQLGSLDVTVSDGAARLTDKGNLAGSTLTMIQAFRYMVETVGISLQHASKLASSNPAQLLGLSDDRGSMEVGKRADLVWVDHELNIVATWVDGHRAAALGRH